MSRERHNQMILDRIHGVPGKEVAGRSGDDPSAPMTTPPDDLSKLADLLEGAVSAEVHCANKADNDPSGFYSIRSNGQAWRNRASLLREAATAIRSLTERADAAQAGWDAAFKIGVQHQEARYAAEAQVTALTARVGELEADRDDWKKTAASWHDAYNRCNERVCQLLTEKLGRDNEQLAPQKQVKGQAIS